MSKTGKHCGKRRNCTFCAISSFVTMFSKSCLLQRRQKASIWGKGLNNFLTYNGSLILNMSFYDIIIHSNIKQILKNIKSKQSLKFQCGKVLTFSHLQNICNRRLWKHVVRNVERLQKWFNNWIEVKALWPKLR